MSRTGVETDGIGAQQVCRRNGVEGYEFIIRTKDYGWDSFYRFLEGFTILQ